VGSSDGFEEGDIDGTKLGNVVGRLDIVGINDGSVDGASVKKKASLSAIFRCFLLSLVVDAPSGTTSTHVLKAAIVGNVSTINIPKSICIV